MIILCDPKKDALNRRNHGISLYEAHALDWGSAYVRVDARKVYRETRYIAHALRGDRLHVAVFALYARDEVLWMISLRKANRREVKRYVAQN